MRALSSISVLLVSCLLWSCEGSFGTNDAGGSTQTAIDTNWFHFANTHIGVTISGDLARLGSNPPPSSRVVIAWETLSASNSSFIFYGGTTITPSSGGGKPGTYTLTLPDSLPATGITIDSIAKSAIAVGHVFLTNDPRIHDTLVVPVDKLDKYSLLGTAVVAYGPGISNAMAIVYSEGAPRTPGVILHGNDVWVDSVCFPGSYNFLVKDKSNFGVTPYQLIQHYDIDDLPHNGSQEFDFWLSKD
jgi:hypothetical protein